MIVRVSGVAENNARLSATSRGYFYQLPCNIFIFLNQPSTSFCASSALASLITRYCPSRSNQVRLQEARRLMLAQDMDAASAGFRVGYEDPSYFSRDYKKQFGAPPQRDIARLRNNLGP
jgi:AraC-like DNA-binding protein